jgi:O-antigen ligase
VSVSRVAGRPLSGRSLLVLLVTTTLVVAAACVILQKPAYFPPLLAAVPLLVFALHAESERVRSGRRPLAVPFIIISLPFGWLLGDKWVLLTQAAVCGLVVMYLALLTPRERASVVRRVMPVLIPATLLAAAFVLSNALSQTLTQADLVRLIQFASAPAFILLAGVYCRSWSDLEALVELILLAVVLQLPVVLAQAFGLTDGLPGPLAQLGAEAFGGTLSNPTITVAGGSSALGFVFRFPGSFGDYELLAEAAGLALVLAVGMIVFSLGSRSRTQLLIAALSALCVGWFTGTRSFIVASALAVIVILVFAVLMSGSRLKRLMRFAAGAAFLALALVLVLPRQVTSGLLSRFLLSDASLTGPDAFNRISLFKTWWELAQSMPWSGYGTQMLAVVQASHPSFELTSPHSLYFSVLLTSGWLGLAALVSLLVAVVVSAVRATRSRRSAAARYWGAVLFAATLYIIVNEAKIEFLRLPFYTDMVFLLFGIIAVVPGLADLGERASDAVDAVMTASATRGSS